MKKIGIVTLYDNNMNFGGQLQARAMQRLFTTDKSEAKIISFNTSKSSYTLKRIKDLGIMEFIKRASNKIRYKILMKRSIFRSEIEKKHQRFISFSEETSHTKTYREESIHQCNEDFDMFVCGSDQIWNPGWWNDILFLGFANKPKVSYAASIGRTVLNDSEIQYISKMTENYSKVSIREKQSQLFLNEKLDRNIEFVLDPTLVIDEAYWNNLAVLPKNNDKYVLFYTLGNASVSKKNIYDEYHKKGYKVYTIAFSKNTYFKADLLYTDYIIKDAGPLEWLGWIKKAAAVYTDSFHAVVFSIIFEKEFVCFEKGSASDKSNENSRIYSLLKLVDLENRIVGYADKVNIVQEDNLIEYTSVKEKISPYRIYSQEYINDCISIVVRDTNCA